MLLVICGRASTAPSFQAGRARDRRHAWRDWRPSAASGI